MKKKKLAAKLTRTKRKLAATRSQLNEMLTIMKKSGMPKAGAKPAAGKAAPAKKTVRKSAAKAKPAAKAAPKPSPAAKRAAAKSGK